MVGGGEGGVVGGGEGGSSRRKGILDKTGGIEG